MDSTPPTGTLTLVFTDIQGSTELWEALGHSFQPVLDLHHRILRKAIQRHRGYEIKTEGDAFMIAFQEACDALAFAFEVQHTLQKADWSDELLALNAAAPSPDGLFRGLRLRMGLHTGNPICDRDASHGRMDYLGPMVNRSARIASAAHGGQILLSGTAFAASGALQHSDGVVEDLGDHRLKGLEETERIRQALPTALAGRKFPPINSLTRSQTNLPQQRTSFIGREREVAQLSGLMASGRRLITITAPGGTGKTRLALRVGAEVLDRFPGGVWMADLSEAKTADDIARHVAAAFSLPLTSNVPALTVVGSCLQARPPLLLILDNFEQIVEHSPETVGHWMKLAPQTTFLVTSRFLLGLTDEIEFSLPPLSAPPATGVAATHDLLAGYDSVNLFVERARESKPDFAITDANARDIAQICTELEGIPLAIELAAARVRIMQPSQIVAKLHQKFELLSSSRRDLPHRQRTLLGAIDWSYELLKEHEKSALTQLALLRGGFFLDTAEAVVNLEAYPGSPAVLDVVQALRDKSFLRGQETPYEVRFGMYMTLHEYMDEKLERLLATDGGGTLLRMANHHSQYIDSWYSERHKGRGAEARVRIILEIENLVAIDTRLQRGGVGADVAVEFSLQLSHALRMGNAWPSAARAAEHSLMLARTLENQGLINRALLSLGEIEQLQGHFDVSLKLLQDALVLSVSLMDHPLILATYEKIGSIHLSRGAPQEALKYFSPALALSREIGDRYQEASALGNMGIALHECGSHDKALAHLEEALALSMTPGIGDVVQQAKLSGHVGAIFISSGQYDKALSHLQQALDMTVKLGYRQAESKLRANMGVVHRLRGAHDVAIDSIKASLLIDRELGDRVSEALHLRNLALAYFYFKAYDEALQHHMVAHGIETSLGIQNKQANHFGYIGLIHKAKGSLDEALSCFSQAMTLAKGAGNRWGEVNWIGHVGLTLHQAGRDPVEAKKHLGDAIGIRAEIGLPRDPQLEAALAECEAKLRGDTYAGPSTPP